VFDRSFKGSHISLMIELLAGIYNTFNYSYAVYFDTISCVTGAWTGPSMSDKHTSRNWGSLVLALDPHKAQLWAHWKSFKIELV
jgi:LDH2 family malate/lactate/ureidoglycolate dehydrogenase